MLVYIYPSGRRVKYDDGKRYWDYIEMPHPDLVLDDWHFEELLMARRRSRKKSNTKAAAKSKHATGSFSKRKSAPS
jgi:hypothetical protein